uniref:Uncharacterized protein n=1 Tax=Anguilla anguilla TaxID=7936 RepID=A0A0E9TPT6_ANGAN
MFASFVYTCTVNAKCTLGYVSASFKKGF